VSDLRTVNPLSEAFVAAGEEAGFQRILISTARSKMALAFIRSRKARASATAQRQLFFIPWRHEKT